MGTQAYVGRECTVDRLPGNVAIRDATFILPSTQRVPLRQKLLIRLLDKNVLRRAKFWMMGSMALAVAFGMCLPAVAAEGENSLEKTIVKWSNLTLTPAVDNVEDVQTAQFALPKPSAKGKSPVQQLPKFLEFQYAIGTELEAPFSRDLDLDNNLPDKSFILLPTLSASLTYRHTDWLESSVELSLERPYTVSEEDPLFLPDGTIKRKEFKERLSLLVKQAYLKLKAPRVPIELIVGRQTFADARLWLYDTELDSVMVTVKVEDFKIDTSVSRENLFDWDLLVPVLDSKVTNWMVYIEYRGIEDHKLVGYWIHRVDFNRPNEEGRPHFYGVRAYGNPSDRFNYWIEAAIVRGIDETHTKLRGQAIDIGGTYRFVDLPLQPNVTLGYAFGSGDENPNDFRNNQFRQTGLQANESRFGGVTEARAYGETVNPELSNLQIYTVGVGIRPFANVFLDLVYHHYRLDEIAEELRGSSITAQMNQVPELRSKDVGSEFDIIVGIRNLLGIRGLASDLRVGVFFPGDAFRREEPEGNIRDPDKGISFFVKLVYGFL